MANEHLSRRRLIQKASALLIASSITPTLFGQVNKKFSCKDIEPVYLPPGAGLKGKIANTEIIFKLNKDQTSGNIGSAEMTIPPGQLGAPPHYHKSFDEICIVLEGTLHIMVEEEVFKVEAGGWHLRPRGKTHTFWNSGKNNAKVIEIYSPAGHESYMMELAKLFKKGTNPNADDLEKLASLYDITFQFDKLDAIVKKYKVTL